MSKLLLSKVIAASQSGWAVLAKLYDLLPREEKPGNDVC
jgi:hypothetical protein